MPQLPDFSDPFAVEQFLERNRRETDALRRDMAERQERRLYGEEPQTWHAPEPEPQPEVSRRRDTSRDSSREWTAHIESRIAAAQRATNKRADQRFEATEKAIGMALGQLRRDFEDKISALEQQVAALKREVDLLAEEKAIDVRGLFKGGRDAA